MRPAQLARQEPGPRGSPQAPQEPAACRGGAPDDLADTAKTECCFSSDVPWHAGQDAGREAVTSVSNCWWQVRQIYSNSGMARPVQAL